MSTTVDKHRVDEAMDAYLDWRECCLDLQNAYDRWARAPRSKAGAAFLEYMITLDREERASLQYALRLWGVRQ